MTAELKTNNLNLLFDLNNEITNLNSKNNETLNNETNSSLAKEEERVEFFVADTTSSTAPFSSNSSLNKDNNNNLNTNGVVFESTNDRAYFKSKFNVTKPPTNLESFDLEENSLENIPLTPIDTLPNENNYRDISVVGLIKSRPTLSELQNHKRSSTCDSDLSKKKNEKFHISNKDLNVNCVNSRQSIPTATTTTNVNTNDVVKFGWIKGVLIRCILNIFGVMIFLRISWVTGQAGVGLATVIVLLATLVTFITALSTSAICTNGEVRGGGAYYLISRSLGPEFGGAIGIVYSFANAVAAAMYVIGFSETLVALFKDHNILITDGAINDVRIIGLVTNVILLIIALIGMSWETKVQIFLLGILAVALVNFVIGSFMGGSNTKKARGFEGYSFKLFKENFLPDFRGSEDFAHVFGVFFPAVTGILAGANISGNLKDPQKAIPKGTLLSVLITSTIYLGFCWICGFTIAREATGVYSENKSYLNCKNTTCKYGLLHNYQVMEMVSELPFFMEGNSPIIIAGIFSASLSSALASLVSAPKIFQAVSQDRIFPKVEFFAKGHGKDNEPWRGYFLTFFIVCAFIGIGDLNEIAPIISNFFLMSYALVNYSCFDASIAKTPGWRPAFKYYNKWISLFGAILCIFVMFIIKWWAALVSFIAIAGLYLYVKQRKLDINWGSSTQAQIYRRSLEYSLKLINIEEHVKNFRPNFLVLTGSPTNRPALCDFVAALTKNTSLMVCSKILLNNEQLCASDNFGNIYAWMRKRKIKSFYTEINSNSLRLGAISLMQSVGIGKLRPNILVMGFKNNWQTDTVESVLDYYEMINDAFQMKFGICILKLDGGLDYSNLLGDDYSQSSLSESDSDQDITIRGSLLERNAILSSSDSNRKNIENLISSQNKNSIEIIVSNSSSNKLNNTHQTSFHKETSNENFNLLKRGLNIANNVVSSKINGSTFFKSTELIKLKNTKINTGVLQGLNIFHRKYQTGYVDVWWLYDDGGLTILLPYLLLQRKYWHKCKLRIFIQAKSEGSDLSEEQRNMAILLSKFRIQFHDLIVFSLHNKKPQASSLLLYEKQIENWRLKPNEKAEDFEWKITDAMYKQNIDKTNFHLRLRELLVENSQNSSLIILTISVPSRLSTCAGLYTSWLDLISHQMPPILMVRGNQTPVLTYYS